METAQGEETTERIVGSLEAWTTEACECLRKGNLLDAHRLILKIAGAARTRPPKDLAVVALQLQTSLALVAKAFSDSAFNVPKIHGDELSHAWASGPTVARLVESFEKHAHELFNAAHTQRFSLPMAQRAKSYIDANCHRPGGIRDIADALGRSVGHISAVFLKNYGVTPAAYLRDLRLDHGARLLDTRPSLSVAEVARLSGFRSPQTSYRNFLARHGLSPGRYRRRRRDECPPRHAT